MEYKMVNSNDEAKIGKRLGTTSENMIRLRFSPIIRADSTKSRLRSDMVCARRTRAPHAHPVKEMMSPMTRELERLLTGR